MVSFMSRLIAMSRSFVLARQIKEIEKCVGEMNKLGLRQLATLTLREMGIASKSEFPHLYGSTIQDPYRPWGDASDQAFERVKSDNSQLKLRGLATWITVVYHETRDSQHNRIATMHKEVQRTLRRLKEALPPPSAAAA